MKKVIFKKLLLEILFFFLISSLSLTLIIWVMQAVNFLDIVTEDGHSFRVYFYYTILSLPKLFSQSLPFVFFISVFYILEDYETKNQLLIYWSHGVRKIFFINKIVKFSILFLLVQILFSVLIVPYTQDKARSFIRGSNLDFFPNLIKPKKFVDTVENLTIFIDSKNLDGSYNNIILKDNSDSENSQTIIAKTGYIILKKNQKLLILNEGKIIKNNKKKNSTVFNFKATQFDLDKYSSKTTKTPKIQELTTNTLIQCFNFLMKNIEKKITIKNINCQKNFLSNLNQELFKRIYAPIYIILLALISSLLVLKSKNSYHYLMFKIKIFLSGILILVISDVSLNFTGVEMFYNIIYLIIPIACFITIYTIMTLNLKINK